jgi:branched-chain amino acid transport system ATP-binding protein
VLELRGVQCAYGRSRILFGIDLAVSAGELVTIVGRNGMGKTTTVRCIVGLLPLTAGRVTFDGQRIDREPSYRICRAGIALVPEGRQIFPNLTVRENLICNGVARAGREGRWTLQRVLALFPRLAERIDQGGNKLSGGEQQMLAIARALMLDPKLLLLDEPSLGLAPIVIREIFEIVSAINRENGTTILVVEQNANLALRSAEKAYILEVGRVTLSGTSDELAKNESIRKSYLGD